MLGNEEEGKEDDYMGDLSMFLPPERTPSSNKRPGPKASAAPQQPSKSKRPRALNWQEQRKLDREQKQREEDEQIKAALDSAIPASIVGFKLLQRMGYTPGSALGKDGAGCVEPVGIEIRRSRAGIGVRSAQEGADRRELAEAERNKRREEELMAEFGSRQKTQWRSRRVVWDYRKAEAVLAQLENREIVEPENDEGEEEKPDEEEEEEEITEEDLHEILMKLRDEHHYCLYCGLKYESAETLLSDCPGPGEDDH